MGQTVEQFLEATTPVACVKGGPSMEADRFCALCTALGADTGNGLGPEDLSELYARYDTLDRDFKVSQEKLQNFVRQVPVRQAPVRQAPVRQAPVKCQATPLLPALALGVPAAMMTVLAVGVAK